MRDFTDQTGREWCAFVREEEGADYKGRMYLVLQPLDSKEGEALELKDVRWNSERTAQRTLDTMSLVELRRRLRSAVGRGGSSRAS